MKTRTKQLITERLQTQNQQEQELIKSVIQDFEQWRARRQKYESQWTLNAKFVAGEQFSVIDFRGEVGESEMDYAWQQRQVYNHIAPIVETRLAKLGRVRPQMSVRPSSNDESDVRTAKVCSKLLASSCERVKLDEKITDATTLSEMMGCAFYKISWDTRLGREVISESGEAGAKSGDVRVEVCSPYEIFVDNPFANGLSEVQSIIHAKRMHKADIHMLWGVVPKSNQPGEGSVAATQIGVPESLEDQQYCMVLERHTRPSVTHPKGQLVIVAGDTLLHSGELPFRVGRDGQVELPFVMQKAISVPGAFYGSSVVERCIPLQRAYNAVKNRKHEFINRIAAGVLAVEDGSIDVDNLVEYGLAPGKILSYRQGSTPPQMLDTGRVPPEFNYEEDRLLSEFVTVSGVSEIMRNSSLPTSVTSGTAITLLIEQDDTRLSLTAQSIRNAIRALAQMLLRLYRQYAGVARLDRVVGDDGQVELLSWKKSDLSSDDVVFDTANELSSTPATKQNMLFELLKVGLLTDANGKMSEGTRYKLLDSLGYGGWERGKSLDGQHIKRAELENIACLAKKPKVVEIDDHNLHMETHTAYLLFGDNLESDKKQVLLDHIREHRQVTVQEQIALTQSQDLTQTQK